MEAHRLFKNLEPETKVISLPQIPVEEISLVQQLMMMGKLVYPTLKGFECIPWNEIQFLEADGNYTRIHTAARKIVLSQTLKKLEEQLPARLFFRVHRSYMVNIQYIKAYQSFSDSQYLILEDETCIPVSRTIRAKFR
jgi:two-component system LytT family response regulator